MKPILEVTDLNTVFESNGENIHAVKDVSFHVNPGELLCLVGESGSGKSVTSLSIMRLLQGTTGKIVKGSVMLNGTDLTKLTDKEMRKYRGSEISMIFQEPMTSLNPVLKIGYQMIRTVMLHQKVSKSEAKRLSIEFLKKVRIKNAEKVFYAYPHEVSGGMRQRIMIASAIVNRPKILICDEPTSALDVIVQARIIRLIKELCLEENISVLFITHDMSVVAQIADRVAVMYKGRIVESRGAEDIFYRPEHPYTRELLHSISRMKDGELEHIEESNSIAAQTILKVEHLKKNFKVPGKSLFGKSKILKALDDVSFELKDGETIGIVGESGCGKTTLGQIICGLQRPTEGNIMYFGKTLDEIKKSSKVQIVFQDPYSSLNPKMKVGDLIAEPIDADKGSRPLDKKERRGKIEEYMHLVELDTKYIDSYPKELSGGMRQRVGIARALMSDAKMIVCDEAVSALDVSVQAQIMKLLDKIKRERRISFVFISHDLNVVYFISDQILVLYNGVIVEYGRKKQLFENPLHPYTVELLSSIPKPDPSVPMEVKEIEGIDQLYDGQGCPYKNSCACKENRCGRQRPELREVQKGHWVLCHRNYE